MQPETAKQVCARCWSVYNVGYNGTGDKSYAPTPQHALLRRRTNIIVSQLLNRGTRAGRHDALLTNAISIDASHGFGGNTFRTQQI